MRAKLRQLVLRVLPFVIGGDPGVDGDPLQFGPLALNRSIHSQGFVQKNTANYKAKIGPGPIPFCSHAPYASCCLHPARESACLPCFIKADYYSDTATYGSWSTKYEPAPQ